MMKYLFVIFSVVSLVSAEFEETTGFSPLVVGGTISPNGSYPFVAALRAKLSKQFFCGGALVGKRFVLTAAHCTEDGANNIVVGVGSVHLSEQTFHNVDDIIIHPDYSSQDTVADLALLKLSEPVELSETVRLIQFPYLGELTGKNVTALGWGRTDFMDEYSPVLLYLKTRILSNQECSRRFNGTSAHIRWEHVCIDSQKKSGMCSGDSGSPLLYEESNNFFLVGVVSWGRPCAVGFPDVFARVSLYSEWLRRTMNDNSN